MKQDVLAAGRTCDVHFHLCALSLEHREIVKNSVLSCRMAEVLLFPSAAVGHEAWPIIAQTSISAYTIEHIVQCSHRRNYSVSENMPTKIKTTYVWMYIVVWIIVVYT